MEGDASPRTRSRWSMNVGNTLNSPRARAKFRQFLEKEYPREPDSLQLDTLDFWEQCNTILTTSAQSKASKIRDVHRLVERVDSGDLIVNLDVAWLERLHRVKDYTSMQAAVKQALAELTTSDPDLQEAFSDFTKTLNKK